MNEDFGAAMTLPTWEEEVTKIVWTPPLRDCYKINVDAAYSSASRTTSSRVMARGMAVEVCFSTVAKVSDIESPSYAELNAILFGL